VLIDDKPIGVALNRNPGSLTAPGEAVEKELDAMIERRSRQKDVDPDEQEEIWKASVRAYTARRREEMRAVWCEHHQGQAERLRAVLEELIAHHEEQAAKLNIMGLNKPPPPEYSRAERKRSFRTL
jgi:hypothetical protein